MSDFVGEAVAQRLEGEETAWALGGDHHRLRCCGAGLPPPARSERAGRVLRPASDAARLARPFADRLAPRARAALPLEPVERFPVSLPMASRCARRACRPCRPRDRDVMTSWLSSSVERSIDEGQIATLRLRPLHPGHRSVQPQRHAAIRARVAAIRTHQEALDYIREVGERASSAREAQTDRVAL
jgi:hypothetical protein